MNPSRRWCVTKHFNVSDFSIRYDDAELDLACEFLHNVPSEFSQARYAIFQVERGQDTGKYHCQGYLELSKPIRLTGVKSTFPCLADAHLEAARGTREAARDYCRKEDTAVLGPVEVGHWDAGGQGHRSDLDALVEAVQEGQDDHAIATAYPKAFLLHGSKIASLRAALAKKPEDKGFQPRPWQQELIDELKEEADDRTIIWVLDSKGGQGKSRLAFHLYCEYGACVLDGKVNDMAYAYNGERIVIFDISRAAAEHSDHLYSMAEKIKNRLVVSGKYNSCTKVADHKVHVVFFANEHPKDGKWSEDRVKTINLDIIV